MKYKPNTARVMNKLGAITIVSGGIAMLKISGDVTVLATSLFIAPFMWCTKRRLFDSRD